MLHTQLLVFLQLLILLTVFSLSYQHVHVYLWKLAPDWQYLK